MEDWKTFLKKSKVSFDLGPPSGKHEDSNMPIVSSPLAAPHTPCLHKKLMEGSYAFRPNIGVLESKILENEVKYIEHS